MFFRVLVISLYFIPTVIFAQVQINEIMYNLEGTDEKREWIELYNSGSADVDLTGWKFNDGDNEQNHGLNVPPKNDSRGSIIISAGGYIILVGNATTFIEENSNYTGTVIDTVMSLGNISETLLLIDGDGNTVDSVSYTKDLGANGDGNSLQLVGGSFIAKTPTLGLSNSNNSSEQTSNENQNNNESPGGLSFPIEPQIFAEIDLGDVLIVGADSVFSANSYGLKGEPIDNARYLWNFGDGSTKEGKSVFHTYSYPGEYIVNVDVTSGKYTASDRKIVNVIDSEIAISTANNEYIELKNNSDFEMDVSLWLLKSNGKFFTIPMNTFVLSKKTIIFPNQTTGLVVNNTYDVTLHYPNGNLAKTTSNSLEEQVVTTQNRQVEYVYIEKPESENKEEINNISESNIASPVLQEESESNSLYKWLLALVAIVGFAILLVTSIDKKDKLKKDEELSADDFKILND